MKSYLILLILPILFYSCVNEVNEKVVTKKVKVNQSEVDFSKFLKKVPEAKLPMDIVCGFDGGADINLEKFKFKVPNDMNVVSKISLESNYTLVSYYGVGNILYPFIYSYNEKGEVLDSIGLQNGFCAGDPWLESAPWTRIDSEVNIEMIDTLRYFTFEDPLRELDSVIISKKMVNMNSSGHFVTVSDESIKL